MRPRPAPHLAGGPSSLFTSPPKGRFCGTPLPPFLAPREGGPACEARRVWVSSQPPFKGQAKRGSVSFASHLCLVSYEPPPPLVSALNGFELAAPGRVFLKKDVHVTVTTSVKADLGDPHVLAVIDVVNADVVFLTDEEGQPAVCILSHGSEKIGRASCRERV